MLNSFLFPSLFLIKLALDYSDALSN